MQRSLILVCLVVSGLLISCGITQSRTPEIFKNHTNVDGAIYGRHIKALSDSIAALIRAKEDPYYQTENDSLTEIIIDTILYSPEMNRFAFFAITKNGDDKLLDKGDKNHFHYDAHCFIGRLDHTKDILDLTWIRGHNLSNYPDQNEASQRIRELYFTEITERTNANNESTYKYNFDDIRFWNGPLWNVYYQ